MPDDAAPRIAFFISPHGFGHAARASALMLALARRLPALGFDLYTTVPDRFFDQSGIHRRDRFPLMCDVGMVQRSPLQEDLPASIDRLRRFYPLRPGVVGRLARRLKRRNCRLAICDIAPMGLAVARAAGLPGILVDNFTWDWIYEGYAQQDPEFSRTARYLAGLYDLADCRIRTRPLCGKSAADLTVGPIARPPRRSGADTRARLGIPEDTAMVLVTMGGVRLSQLAMSPSPTPQRIRYVIPGVAQAARPQADCLYLPHFSKHYHPDLMAAAQAVVAKAGYSTIAEARAAALPFGYVTRPGFRESAILDAYIRERMPSLHIPRQAFHSGRWVEKIPDLLQLPRHQPPSTDAGLQVADYLIDRYGSCLKD